MTQHLETLKGILQKVLSDGEENRFYYQAIQDGAYACNLSIAALEQWAGSWLTTELVTLTESEYRKGVQFVAEQWDKIVSESNEGED